MILHGGHDGSRHLQDTHVFDFHTLTWTALITDGPIPSPRDSHVSVIHGNSMFLYGGSTGSAVGDFHELKLEFRRLWSPVICQGEPYPGANAPSSATNNAATPNAAAASSAGARRASSASPARLGGAASTVGNNATHSSSSCSSGMDAENTPADVPSKPVYCNPGVRFCHVGVVYENAFYIFGGYDGNHRLNDFLRFRFDQVELDSVPPPSTLISDLKSYVGNEALSDVQFIVEGIPIHAHKILCLRCPFFKNLLTGEYMESRAREIVMHDVKYATFLFILEYLYCDEVDRTRIRNISFAMDLFQAADRFGIDRLKRLCEIEMLDSINIETAMHILYSADQYNAENLRNKCMEYILRHFDEVSRTLGFEEVGRTNVDLVFEILRRR